MTHGVRATVAVCLASLALTAAEAPSASADRTYFVPVSRMWDVTGHGYGHGHGLSQYGAQGAALTGMGYAAISKFYYPKTSWDTVKGHVRVLLSADFTSDVQVAARPGLTVRDVDAHTAWKLPSRPGRTRWRMTPGKNVSTAVQFLNSKGWHRWRVPNGQGTLTGDGQFRAPGPLTLFVPNGGAVAPRKYRGILRSVRPGSGSARDTVNIVTMDQYVRGVVPNEMPTSWEQQALRAQSVAARTYAAWQRAQNARRYYQICDTTACQVYGGATGEALSSNAAVKATAGRILTYGGEPAFTQFSASSGGWTSPGGVPYLPAKKDPYDNFPGNGVHTWKTRVSPASLEASHPGIGRLICLRVTRRNGYGSWNGRVEQIRLKGSQGTATMTGDDFRFHYGLRSSWFTLGTTPIITRWRHLGGAKSALGRPRSGEYAVRGGSAQQFQHGRIFWSRQTGARELKGPILAAYLQWAGPRSRLGYPVTGVMGAPGRGHKAAFEAGRIYSTVRTGAHVLYGKILRRWSRTGAAAGSLGFPTTDVHHFKGGLRARFQHGTVTAHRPGGRVTVRRR